MAERNDYKELFGSTLAEDGSLRLVSASQTIVYKRCALKWHFGYKAKLKRKPMGKGAAIGDAAHDRLKTFLRTGQDVRGALEMVGARMLEPYLWAAPGKPWQGPGMVEEPLIAPYVKTPGGVLIGGYFDFYIPGLTGREGTGFEWPTIIDHKFKKKLAEYGIDEEELADDPQTLIYGAWALARQPTADGVVMRHHQHQTEGEGGRFPKPVEVRLTRDDLLRRWGLLAKVVDEGMCATAKVAPAEPGGTPEGVPYNTEACGDFGGCDFELTCKHSPMNRYTMQLRGLPTREGAKPQPQTLGSLVSLLAQVSKPAVPQTAEQTTALLQASIAANPSAGHPDIPFMSEIALDQAKPGNCYLIPGGSVAKYEAMLGARAIFRAKDGGLREVAATDKVKTIDEETLCLFEGRKFEKPAPAPKPAVPAPAAPAPVVDAAKAEKMRKLGIDYVDEKTTAAVSPPDVNPAVVAAPEVKVTTAEAVAAPATTAAPAAEAKPKKQKATPAAPALDPTTSEGPLFLVVNASCSKAVDLAGYVKGLCDALAMKHGTPDIRLAKKESDLAYGGWKACLALEVAKNPPKGLCVIQSSELAEPVIEALTPIAAVVIRGGR